MLFKGPRVTKLEIPSSGMDPELSKKLIQTQKLAFIGKLVFAFALLAVSSAAIFKGITSDSTLKVIINSIQIETNSAMPGVVGIIFASILMLFARINIKVK